MQTILLSPRTHARPSCSIIGGLQCWALPTPVSPLAPRTHRESRPTWEGALHGTLGVLASDGDRVQCHGCGKFFKAAGTHLVRRHGITADDYRRLFGLRTTTGFAGPSVKARLRQLQSSASASTGALVPGLLGSGNVASTMARQLRQGWTLLFGHVGKRTADASSRGMPRHAPMVARSAFGAAGTPRRRRSLAGRSCWPILSTRQLTSRRSARRANDGYSRAKSAGVPLFARQTGKAGACAAPPVTRPGSHAEPVRPGRPADPK